MRREFDSLYPHRVKYCLYLRVFVVKNVDTKGQIVDNFGDMCIKDIFKHDLYFLSIMSDL